jgi:hypothetical protein
MGENGLNGTLPAELGKLTDLEHLCAALRRRHWWTGRRRVLTRCGGAQRMLPEQAQRHDRQLDRLDGEAHSAVSAPLRHRAWVACALRGWYGCADGAAGYSRTIQDAACSAWG